MNIEEINEYYHDKLVKALDIMWCLLDDEMKHNFKLSEYSREKYSGFYRNFNFKCSVEEKTEEGIVNVK